MFNTNALGKLRFVDAVIREENNEQITNRGNFRRVFRLRNENIRAGDPTLEATRRISERKSDGVLTTSYALMQRAAEPSPGAEDVDEIASLDCSRIRVYIHNKAMKGKLFTFSCYYSQPNTHLVFLYV